MAPINPNNRTRFKRLAVTVDSSFLTSSASISTVQINNLDSGGNIVNLPLSQFDEILRSLGFEVGEFNYTGPEFDPE